MNAKNPRLRIKGEKTFLRYVEHADFDEMQALFRLSRKFYRGLINPPTTPDDFRRYVDRNLDVANECFVVCLGEDARIAGAINLSQIFRKAFQNAYLGYSLGAGYTGRGLMTEAVGLALGHAFANLRLHRVEANVQPHNAPSIRVLERCGFTKEGFSRRYLKIGGRWRDHERWAILREDWELQKKK